MMIAISAVDTINNSPLASHLVSAITITAGGRLLHRWLANVKRVSAQIALDMS